MIAPATAPAPPYISLSFKEMGVFVPESAFFGGGVSVARTSDGGIVLGVQHATMPVQKGAASLDTFAMRARSVATAPLVQELTGVWRMYPVTARSALRCWAPQRAFR